VREPVAVQKREVKEHHQEYEGALVLRPALEFFVKAPAKQRQMGVTLQENAVQSIGARQHRVGGSGHAMERVIAASTLAGAHDFILELPEGCSA
jgi:hypothetical protein